MSNEKAPYACGALVPGLSPIQIRCPRLVESVTDDEPIITESRGIPVYDLEVSFFAKIPHYAERFGEGIRQGIHAAFSCWQYFGTLSIFVVDGYLSDNIHPTGIEFE